MTKKPSTVASKQVKQSVQTLEKPRWPDLKPLVPSSDLYLDTIQEGQIVVIRKLFTKALCQRYVSFLSDLPLTTTPGVPRKGEALRVNDRYQINDSEFARMLYETTSLKQFVDESDQDWGGKVLGLNPNIRVYRYTPGQFFGQHYDESNQVVLQTPSETRAKTTWTLLLYLTDSTMGCFGGETVFYPEYGQVKNWGHHSEAIPPISIAPELGMALLHRHGDDCLLHEGKEVISGEKWIIRSDLCVARS